MLTTDGMGSFHGLPGTFAQGLSNSDDNHSSDADMLVALSLTQQVGRKHLLGQSTRIAPCHAVVDAIKGSLSPHLVAAKGMLCRRSCRLIFSAHP
jgi:hypothetical protein